MTSIQPIDVWDHATFDDELLADLERHSALIRSYMDTARSASIHREAGDLPYNPHEDRFRDYVESVRRKMEDRTIRAWHYTRMTDAEVATALREGLYPSTLGSLRRRLSAQVAEGRLTQDVADQLFAASRMHSEPQRVGQFWMVSHLIAPDDSAVRPLLKLWGGEVVSFSLEARAVEPLLTTIGEPRVFEIAVPMAATRHAYPASNAVIDTFAKSLGCRSSAKSFDLYSVEQLPVAAILNVHGEGAHIFRES